MPRRESKPQIDVPRRTWFAHDPAADRAAGWIVRLSIAGVEVESLHPPPVGSRLRLWAELVDGEGEVAMNGRVQWASVGSFAVQFTSLGVRETRAILLASSRPPP